jgi:hypothetical protein
VGVGVTCEGRRSNEKGGLAPTSGGQRERHDMVRTREAPGSLTCGPWPTVGGRERGEARGAWAGPEKKRHGPSPKEQEHF